MRVLISVSMSNKSKVAESIATNHLAQVVDNLAKIFLYRADPLTTKEWTDEIADKHLRVVNNVVNNVKSSKGHLSRDLLAKLWSDAVSERNVRAAIRAASRNVAYKHMKQIKDIDARCLECIQKLSEFNYWFASNILDTSLEQDDKIASALARAVQV